MENKYFNKNTTIREIVMEYPTTLDYLVSVGFTPLKDPKALNTLGRIMSIGKGCALKGIDYDAIENNLINIISDTSITEDVTLAINKSTLEKPDFLMTGVLPCPIRISLQEAMASDEKIQQISPNPRFDLQAASMGIDYIKKSFDKDTNTSPDIVLSVGFEHFFSQKVQKEMFSDDTYICQHPKMSSHFDNEEFTLKDPKNRYFILSMVPCVFLVNKTILGDRTIESWSDLLKPEFENSLSIPLGDLDMFNAICMNIYKDYGYDGIKKLKKANAESMHPAEMASSFKKKNPPAISIIPYFFTKMVYNTDEVEVVWPKDGAMLSPIFLMAKKEKQKELDTLIDFFRKEEIDELLSANGKFPSTLDGASYHLNDNQKLKWVGWEFIDNNDTETIIKKCEEIFGM